MEARSESPCTAELFGCDRDPESGEASECGPCRSDSSNDWVAQAKMTRAVSEASRNCGVLCFTLIMIVLCLVSFAFCQECLFVVLIVSACLCPFFHPLNAPLWLAIVLLTVGGWSFTSGALSITWNNRH
jgi:hypothetical protein